MTDRKLKETQSAHHQRHSSGDAVSKLFSRILIGYIEKAQIRVKKKDAICKLEGTSLNVTELIKWEVWPNMMKIACKCYSINPVGDVHMTTCMHLTSCLITYT